MNPANYREALVETEADEAEGADLLLVKSLFVSWLFFHVKLKDPLGLEPP